MIDIFRTYWIFITQPNGWRLTPLRNSSLPKKRVVIAPGAAWPLPLNSYHFSRNSTIEFRHFRFEPWPRLASRSPSRSIPLGFAHRAVMVAKRGSAAAAG